MRGGEEPEPTSWLLAAAMDSIVFLPFAAGTITSFERDLYEGGLPVDRVAGPLVATRGAPPGGEPRPRPARPSCATPAPRASSHDDPARYYDYALATLIKFQLHDHICRKLLRQDVRACDYGRQQRRWATSCAP